MYMIYKHTLAGKLYIGQTCQSLERRVRHDFSGYKKEYAFGSAIQKYGHENIKTEILYSGLTLEEANRLETLCISRYNTLAPYGYNLSNGGSNTTHSEETIQKISESKKGTPAWNKGISRSAESRKKQSKSRQGKYDGENHPMFGKKHKPESKQMMSESLKGRAGPNLGKKFSAEHCQKISDSKKGVPNYAKRHPMYFTAKEFYLSLPDDMPLSEKRQQIKAFSGAGRTTIYTWLRKWEKGN